MRHHESRHTDTTDPTDPARLTFRDLVASCPALAGLADDARSIAVHERWPWYERWIGSFEPFRFAVEEAAAALGLPFAAVKAVALAGLLDSYHTAKGRQGRRRK